MSNRSSSKQHALVGNIRPKSKIRFRVNKAAAAVRRAARFAKLDEVYQAALAKLG